MIIIGGSVPPVMSAELSLNHGGRLEVALEMIDQVARAGAHAVKVQFYRTEDFAQPGDEMHGVFKNCELSIEDVAACQERARSHGMMFHATPTSPEGVRVLAELGVDAFKVASDMLARPAILAAMRKHPNIPVIVSTGHVKNLKDLTSVAKDDDLVLHCVSEYPAPEPRLWRLRALLELGFEHVGYSHHGYGWTDCVRAAELGAVWIEVHVQNARHPKCLVDKFALTEREVAALCNALA